MENICISCLSTDRKLSYITDPVCYHLFMDILNEIPPSVQYVSSRICWECMAVLRRWRMFRANTKKSNTMLREYLLSTSPNKQLPHTPTLKIHHTPTIELLATPQSERLNGRTLSNQALDPPGTLEGSIKQEEDIKEEPATLNDESHSEDTFANVLEKFDTDTDDFNNEEVEALTPEPIVEQPRKKKKRKEKPPKKKRKISKKKEKSKAVDSASEIKSETDIPNAVCGTETDDAITKSEVGDKCEERDSVQFICDECGDKFVKKVEVKRHIVSLHPQLVGRPPARRPQCVECGKTFSSNKTYKYHLSVLHGGQNRHECPRCGKVYQWKSNLGRHLRSHQLADQDQLFCVLCSRRFASLATYTRHLRLSRRHVAEHDYTFSCDKCGRKFADRTRLRDHVDWDHLNKIKFSCKTCHKAFKCHTSLYVHRRNVHGAQARREHLCHVCGKAYRDISKLRSHMAALHGGAAHRCGQCGAAFSWYSSLHRHTREVHCKVKPPRRRRPEPVILIGDVFNSNVDVPVQ